MATKFATMPEAWSNKRKAERLRADAFASLTRMLSRAVAETGTNFSIYSALRTNSEQRALFVKNYRRRGGRKGASTDRFFEGAWWRRVGVSVAVPGSERSNHESGRSIDIHPGAIQDWIRKNGLRFGWNWEAGRRQNEAWHFEYRPRDDRYKSEGLLDHAAVQKAVGAEVDGKIGTGTVAKIKAFQKKHGLDVDGKVGPATKKALFSGKGEAAPAPSVPATPGGGTSVPTPPVSAPAEPGWMPGASRVQTFSGNSHKAPVTKIVLHTTEGSSWPGYGGGGSAPHFTVKPGAATEENIRQHISTEQSSKALVNKPGGVETNNAGVIQIEYVGSCDRAYAAKHGLFFTEDADDGDLASLAAVLAWISEAHGIPLATAPELSWPTTNAAYASAPQRLSGKAWEAYRGVLGHTHVPENDHWDPGAFPVSRLLALAGSTSTGVAPAPAPSPSKPTTGGGLPTGKDLLMKLADVPDFPLLRTPGNLCYYGSPDGPIESVSGKNTNSLHPGEIETVGGKTRSKGLMTLQRQLVVRGYAVDIDGRWGAQMDNAIDNLQRLAGLVRDKKVGPVTWYAAWLLPVK